MPAHRVPFNRPAILGRELEYVAQSVANGHLAGDGPFARRCERWLEERMGVPRVLLTHSCTAALEMAALLCDIAPGDEVILPSFTFASTANAFVLRGARPVFVDIRPDTLNIDERQVAAAIGPRTRVIAPVHYAGVGADMDRIQELARSHGLRVVEDAAHGFGARYRNRPLGTLGDLGCSSFHETKDMVSGEGGALVIADPLLVERAEILREKGTDRARFFRGEVDKYTWVDLGSSYLPSELVAAFLWGQLEHAERVRERRLLIVERYREALADLEAAGLLRLPVVPPECSPNGHLFYLLMPSEAARDGLLAHLAAVGVNAVFHYLPLHDSPMGRRWGYRRGDLPVTEEVSRRLLRLPCFFALTEAQQELVVAEVRSFLRSAAA